MCQEDLMILIIKKMNTNINNNNSGSAEAWLSAAYTLLTQQGVEAVKVMTLAKQLNVTRTSFYWYFTNRESLLESLIQHWENKNTGNLIMQTEKPADGICEAIFNLFDCWIDNNLFDAQLDLAIRNWARNDASLQIRLDKADERRINAIATMFQRFDYTKAQAQTRSRTIIYTQIGYFFMQVSEGIEKRVVQMPDYIEVFTDCVPSKSDIMQFAKRHQIDATLLI